MKIVEFKESDIDTVFEIQQALLKIEEMHSEVERWFLDTILQEAGNCYLYEKIGYKRTGKIEKVNEKMTLIFYEKQQDKSEFGGEF